MTKYRIGHSFDIHRFKNEGNFILLGGVKIPTDNLSVIAHSDGDCLYHALAESILSSVGLGDLGTYFPDDSETTLNMDSKEIVLFSLNELKKRNYFIANVVLNITLERPKISKYIQKIKENVVSLLCLENEDVSILVGTNESLDDLGKGKGVKVTSTILIYKGE